MTSRTTFAAVAAAASIAFTAPLAAKTISFTAALESESYMGMPSPFAEQPATLNVVIELDEDAEAGLGIGGADGSDLKYPEAVISFEYEAFGPLGASLGAWSASDVELTIGEFDSPLHDGVQFFSQDTTGPDPLNWVFLLFEGDPDIWDSHDIANLTEESLQAMSLGWIDLYTIAGDGALGVRFAIDADSISVSGPNDPIDPNPTPVPLPAGLPLLVAGLGAFGVIRRRRSGATGAKEMQA